MDDALPENWLHSAYIVDEDVRTMEKIQQRQFLRTFVRPTVGQRVELLVLLNRDSARDLRLSGQVMEVKPAPQEIYPMTQKGDRQGSYMLSGFLGQKGVRPANIPEGIVFDPCTCGQEGCEDGYVYMPNDHWKEKLAEDKEACEAVVGGVAGLVGAKHGQEVVCEGRLSFDYDMHRGFEEPPWNDGIPFDGRDIWRFTLVFDDHMRNKWIIKPDSFINMGRNRHPRCWPWSNEHELPYERTGVDRFERDANDQIMIHMCIGPFGCDGSDHPHNYAGAA